jgi:hypothetical protein
MFYLEHVQILALGTSHRTYLPFMLLDPTHVIGLTFGVTVATTDAP